MQADEGRTYRFTEHWKITALAGVTPLLDDPADSPVVDDMGSATLGVASISIGCSF